MSANIKVTKSQVLRAIERLKIKREKVYPYTVARTLDVPITNLYTDMEILSSIYKYGSAPIGPDLVIQELVSKLGSFERKLKRRDNKLKAAEELNKKAYSEGFSEAAAMNFNFDHSNTPATTNSEENWARGVLYLEQNMVLSYELIKSAYRRLVMVLHPDQSGEETAVLMHSLNKAYQFLLEKYAK